VVEGTLDWDYFVEALLLLAYVGLLNLMVPLDVTIRQEDLKYFIE
jgi:site-specific recombinase